jgi:hypothetical protein
MIIKGVLFFLIIVTIVYVFIDQKSQNELIDSLRNEISTLKKSIDIRIKQELNKVITQEIIDKIKKEISDDLDNIVKKQFEISKAEFKYKLSQEQQEEIIRFTKEYTDQEIKKTFDDFNEKEFKPLKDRYYQNEQKINKKVNALESKLNKTLDDISVTINAKFAKYKLDNIDPIESKIVNSIKLLKSMDNRITINSNAIIDLKSMDKINSNAIIDLNDLLENHIGVDPINLIDFDVKEALSINVNGEEDNAGGPSYLIFDNQKMSNEKKEAIVTFTAKYDIKVYGIFIGMGGNGGRGYLRGQDHNHPVAYGGNGSGGQDGVRYNFNLKKGEKFYVQFQSKGYSILKTPENEIKLRQGSSSKGGSGGGHNSYGQPGKNSTGPDVSDIIKTHKKKDNTLIFSSLPKKFGGGGAGGYGGWWHNDRFGKSGYYGIGGGSRGRSNQMSAQHAIRNYGAGGGANSSISGNPRPGQLIFSGPGGQGGPSGLIMVIEKI